MKPESLEDILENEFQEESFLECLDAMRDTPEDYLFGVPSLSEMEQSCKEEEL